MAQVVWSPSALRDIEQIAEFIAKDSPDQAALFVTRLMEATERLSRFPRSGRAIAEICDPACREIAFKGYRIMYRLEGKEVWITGVVHGMRDWKSGSP